MPLELSKWSHSHLLGFAAVDKNQQYLRPIGQNSNTVSFSDDSQKTPHPAALEASDAAKQRRRNAELMEFLTGQTLVIMGLLLATILRIQCQAINEVL